MFHFKRKFVDKFNCNIFYFKIKVLGLSVLLNNQIKSIVCFDTFILIEGQNKIRLSIKTSVLRKSCPCAFCAGEKDVFGNKYTASNPTSLSVESFKIISYSLVGLYGVRFTWGDNHSDGIYTYDLLKKLNE